jgi:hypothetical protein
VSVWETGRIQIGKKIQKSFGESPQMNTGHPFTRTFDWVWRAALTGALACGVWSAGRVGVGAWFARRGSNEDLARAIRWAPDDAENDAALARLDELGASSAGGAHALRLRRRATTLEPGNATYWLELGMSEDEAGVPEDAEADYLRARDLFPFSPDVNRSLGEYYLREGRIGDALDALRLTIAGDPEMRADVFGELWRAGVATREVLERGAAPDRATLLAYLDTLAVEGALDDAHLVWTRLEAPGGSGASAQDASPYVDALIENERTAELRAVWAEVAPAQAAAGHAAGDLISNGSFEAPMLNEGLDWRVIPVAGAFASVDGSTAYEGARSLRIEFDAPSTPLAARGYRSPPQRTRFDPRRRRARSSPCRPRYPPNLRRLRAPRPAISLRESGRPPA